MGEIFRETFGENRHNVAVNLTFDPRSLISIKFEPVRQATFLAKIAFKFVLHFDGILFNDSQAYTQTN